MLTLPNGCSCSKISVHPKNWEKGKHDLSKDWYINYRFYDPTMPKPKQVIIKGMNVYKDISDRRSATRTLLETEQDLLFNQGYNPFLGKLVKPAYSDSGIDPTTPFITALWSAYELIDKAKTTKSDIKSVITGVEKASLVCGFSATPISFITRKHIKRIFQECKNVVPGWSANRHNKYRSYMKIIFDELIECEATEIDPVSRIKKQKTVRKLRRVLTIDERKIINDHLQKKYYTFWRFMQIFFHSGARETELMRMKKSDVDLSGQRYKVVIQKGQHYIETWKVIKDIALPLWQEILKGCSENQYIFSKGLVPGKVMIRADQITRRWRSHVKETPENGGLGIDVDFYALKHLNTSEVVDALDEKAAAALNSHQSSAMVVKIYDVKQGDRQHKRLKGVNNSFA